MSSPADDLRALLREKTNMDDAVRYPAPTDQQIDDWRDALCEWFDGSAEAVLALLDAAQAFTNSYTTGPFTQDLAAAVRRLTQETT